MRTLNLKANSSHTLNSAPAEKLLDDVGMNILFELQENARISFSELGRRVGLTAPAVAERMHRMEEAGIITGYHTQVNLEKLGLPISVLIHLDTVDYRCHDLGEELKDVPEVLECYHITGDDDLVVRAAFASVADLETLLRRLAQHGEITTSLILSTYIARRSIR